VLAITALVMLVGVRQGVRWAVFHEADQMLIDENREISLAIAGSRGQDLSLLKEDLSYKAMGHQHKGWFAELLDDDGGLIWASDAAPLDLLYHDAAKDQVPYSIGQLRIVESQVSGGELDISRLRIGARLDLIYRDIAHIDRLMSIALATLVLIAPIGGYWLAGRASRTLGNIIHTAARLRPSHLEERLKVHGSGDELDELSKTINGLLDRIAAYLEQKRDFLANAAHELRTPLAAIRSSIEVGLSGDHSSGEYADVLEDLIDQATSLETLVNQLLLLSEAEAESLPSAGSLEIVPLHEVVTRAVDMFMGVAETKEIDLHLVNVPTVNIRGFRTQIRQVVNNLVDNAIKYTEPGGKIQVELEVLEKENVVRLRVQDNGIGISGEDLPHVFNRFFRADRSRSRSLSIGGTGLGLSICQAVVNSHGGTITCRSVLNEGTTMEILLPLGEETAPGVRGEGDSAGRH